MHKLWLPKPYYWALWEHIMSFYSSGSLLMLFLLPGMLFPPFFIEKFYLSFASGSHTTSLVNMYLIALQRIIFFHLLCWLHIGLVPHWTMPSSRIHCVAEKSFSNWKVPSWGCRKLDLGCNSISFYLLNHTPYIQRESNFIELSNLTYPKSGKKSHLH